MARHQLSAFSYQRSAFSYQLSAISGQLSAVSFQRSAISSQLSAKRRKIIFLVGPTAVGKSGVAAELAKKINAEIVSCDSMQIYKGMDILTSKPPAGLLKKVRHHLLSSVSLNKEYDVSQYRKDALKKIKDIIKRKKTPLFVGGTGLYLSVLVDGIFEEKPVNKKIRLRLYGSAKKYGSGYLHRRLQKVDSKAAAKIHPHDLKRIIRALEVYEACGKPISELQRQRQGLKDDYDVRIICLNMERQRLYSRIDERVEKMFGQGLVAEVKNLRKKKLSKTARFAIGIRELGGYLDGEYDLEEAKRLMQRNSRRYAKRQLTWFRKDKRIKWVSVTGKEKPKAVADRILPFIRE